MLKLHVLFRGLRVAALAGLLTALFACGSSPGTPTPAALDGSPGPAADGGQPPGPPPPSCDAGPCDGGLAPLVEEAFETHASIFGRVVDVNGAPLSTATIEAFDIPVRAPARSDLVLTTSADGSFRARLMAIPESAPEDTPAAHVLLKVHTATSIVAMREVYLHPGEVADIGTIMLVEHDSKVTPIGPAGGVATDSSGDYELTVPPGALATTINVQITPFRTREQFSLPLPDATVTMYGFDLAPDGTKFAIPATLRVQNTKNIPTSIEIPMGSGNLETGEWEHQGLATWDGTRFSGPVYHFSPGDLNSTRRGMWVLNYGLGPSPGNSKSTACAGSTAGLLNGVLKASIPLPTVARHLTPRASALTYSSDLAGTFRPQPPQASKPDIPYSAYPASGHRVLVQQSKAEIRCVAPAEAAAAIAASPGTCVAGSCGAGAAMAFGVNANVSWTGGGNANAKAEVPAAADAYIDGVFSVPSGTVGVAAPGFQMQHISISMAAGSTCIGGRSGFGQAAANNIAVSAQVEAGPLALSRPQFVPHRMNSPFGPGWMYEGWSRLYRDPTHSITVVMDAEGTPEYFGPHFFAKPLMSGINSPVKVFAVDPTTGQLLAYNRQSFTIVEIADDGSQTTLFPAHPNTEISDLAITYWAGERHILLASASGTYDVSAAGTRTIAMPAGVRPTATPHLAAQGTQLVLAIGGAGTGGPFVASPQWYTANLGDAQPTYLAMGASKSGSLMANPRRPVSEVQFADPSGVAFAADGTLYLTDRGRNLVFQVRPNASHLIAADSVVERAFGDGIGQIVPPKGLRFPGERLPLNQPQQISIASDGLVWVATATGMARYHPQSQEAEFVLGDAAGGTEQELQGQPLAGGAFAAVRGGKLYYAPAGGWTVFAAEVRLASQYEPTRTLDFDPSGAALLTDTSADLITAYDGIGRVTERRTRSGELVESFHYENATTGNVSEIVNSAGDATTFRYTSGRVTAIADAAGRTTELAFDASGNLQRIKLPDGAAHNFEYADFKLTRRTAPNGDATQYRYGSDGVLRGTTKPAGEMYVIRPSLTEPITRDAAGFSVRKGQYTDPHGVTHVFVSNDKGTLEREEYTADGTTYVKKFVYASEFTDALPQGLPSLLPNVHDFMPLHFVNTLGRLDHVELNGLPIGYRYLWDSQGRLRAFGDAVGQVPFGIDSTIYYGPDERPREAWMGGNNYVRNGYDARGHLIEVAKSDGFGDFAHPHQVEARSYRADGFLASQTTNGLTTTFDYDTFGLVTRTSDSLGRSATFGHDAAGNVVSASDGQASGTFAFDANGRLTASTDAQGNQTTYGYTGTGCGCSQEDRLTELHTPDLPAGKSWKFDYGPEGRLVLATDPDGKSDQYLRRDTGEIKEAQDRLGRVLQATFDQLGRVLTTTDPLGRTRAQSYPVPGPSGWQGSQVLSAATGGLPEQDPTASLASGAYQLGTGAYSQSEYRGLGLPRTTYYRDATTQLAYIHDYLAPHAQPTGLADASEVSPIYSGNITSAPASTGAYRNATVIYDIEFQTHPTALSFRANANNGSDEATYDEDWNVTKQARSPASGGTTEYDREAGGRLTATRTYGGFPDVHFADVHADAQYKYFPNGYLKEANNADGPHAFTYDTRGKLATLTAAEGIYTFDYDVSGRPARLTYPDGHERLQTFDAQSRLTSRCYHYPTNPTLDRCYKATYDAVGNVLRQEDPEGIDLYTVDSLNRITSATRQTAGAADVVASYSYNALGALKQNGPFALSDERPLLHGPGTAPSGVPAAVNGRQVLRNLGGDVTAIGGNTFTFDRLGYLQEVSEPRGADTETYRYTYDADHRRFQETRANAAGTANTYYAYEGPNLIAELAGTPLAIQRSWLYAGIDHPLRLRDARAPGGLAYYELDIAGNVRRLRGQSGTDLGGYRYAVFGAEEAHDAKTPQPIVDQPLNWKGRYWNNFGGSFGVYDMRARVWAPELGTFLSADALAYHDARSTLWGWPGQNPIVYSDPSGHQGDSNAIRDSVMGGGLLSYLPSFKLFAVGTQIRADGIAMMGNDATFEAGDAKRRCGSDIIGLAMGIAGNDAQVLVGAAGMLPGVVRSAELVGGAAAEGAAGAVDANTIRFTQDSIGRAFNGEGAATLRETIDGLQSGAISPEGFPAIRVFERNGLTFTLDNRRLFVFQQAGVPIGTVPATADEVAAEAWKFTTRNDGASIRVRGGL